jgi:hypothetical protein
MGVHDHPETHDRPAGAPSGPRPRRRGEPALAMLGLQRAAGNAAVGRLLARQPVQDVDKPQRRPAVTGLYGQLLKLKRLQVIARLKAMKQTDLEDLGTYAPVPTTDAELRDQRRVMVDFAISAERSLRDGKFDLVVSDMEGWSERDMRAFVEGRTAVQLSRLSTATQQARLDEKSRATLRSIITHSLAVRIGTEKQSTALEELRGLPRDQIEAIDKAGGKQAAELHKRIQKVGEEVASWDVVVKPGFQVSKRTRWAPQPGKPFIAFVGDTVEVRTTFRSLPDHSRLKAGADTKLQADQGKWESAGTYLQTFHLDKVGKHELEPWVLGPTLKTYARKRTFDVVGRSIDADGVKTKIQLALERWRNQTAAGIRDAKFTGGDANAEKWFWFALAGNLLWAATAFVNPALFVELQVVKHLTKAQQDQALKAAEQASSTMIKWMSVSGATVGSGSLQKASEKLRKGAPPEEFKALIEKDLFDRNDKMKDDDALVAAVWSEFERRGIVDVDDIGQSRERDDATWDMLFSGSVPKGTNAIKENAKANAEAIWSEFRKRVDDYESEWDDWDVWNVHGKDLYRNRTAFLLAAYYTALVTSGVVKQLTWIKAPARHTQKIRGAGVRYYDVNYASYEIPRGTGSVTVDVLEKSPGAPDLIAEAPFERTYKRLGGK